jgi:hypothetical protein
MLLKIELGIHTMKMEQIREMLVVHATYAQVEPLWTCLQAKMEENIKTRQD